MIFYHGTNRRTLELMRQEGALWGRPTKDGYRYTYLSPDRIIARRFGSGVLLQVEYEPKGNKGKVLEEIEDNYQFECPPDIKYQPGMFCWQFSVFVPIPMSQVIVLEDELAGSQLRLENGRFVEI